MGVQSSYTSLVCLLQYAASHTANLEQYLLCAEKQRLMQLKVLNLRSNELAGSLPEAWGRLDSVSPMFELT